jgi:lycopene beta-cyclase
MWEYLLVLGLCLLVTAPLELGLGARVYRSPARLLRTLGAVGVVFVTWDLIGARLGHWDYHPRFITGVHLLGLPIEEWLFFVVIPVCGILAYEAVRLTLDRVVDRTTRRSR